MSLESLHKNKAFVILCMCNLVMPRERTLDVVHYRGNDVHEPKYFLYLQLYICIHTHLHLTSMHVNYTVPLCLFRSCMQSLLFSITYRYACLVPIVSSQSCFTVNVVHEIIFLRNDSKMFPVHVQLTLKNLL